MAAKQLTLLEALGSRSKKLNLAEALEDSSNLESPSDIEVIAIVLEGDSLKSLVETDEQCDWRRKVEQNSQINPSVPTIMTS